MLWRHASPLDARPLLWRHVPSRDAKRRIFWTSTSEECQVGAPDTTSRLCAPLSSLRVSRHPEPVEGRRDRSNLSSSSCLPAPCPARWLCFTPPILQFRRFRKFKGNKHGLGLFYTIPQIGGRRPSSSADIGAFVVDGDGHHAHPPNWVRILKKGVPCFCPFHSHPAATLSFPLPYCHPGRHIVIPAKAGIQGCAADLLV